MNARLALALLGLVTAPLAAQAKPPSRQHRAARHRGAATALLREVFAYEGGGRDPSSRSQDGRHPAAPDRLKLVGVYYDGRYPVRSVAVLRDVTNNKIYRAKGGDIVGRLKVTTIRP